MNNHDGSLTGTATTVDCMTTYSNTKTNRNDSRTIMSEYTVRNTDIQKQICELIGLQWEGLQAVTIKMTIGGTVEVDAQFYVMTKKSNTDA
jgi:hypothetical protein